MRLFEKKSARALFDKAEQAAMDRMKNGQAIRLSPPASKDESKDEATIYLYDAIGAWFGISASEFVRELNGLKAKTIHLRINSPGGSVFEAEAIQTAIQQHAAKVIAHIDGLAASAATYIATAADEIEASDGAFWMVHNAWGVAIGDSAEMRSYADMMDKLNANIAQDYQRKTGKSAEQVKEWMDNETWFSAAEALDAGFVDRIYPENPEDSGDSEGKDSDSPEKASDTAKSEEKAGDGGRSARSRALALLEVGA